MRLLDRYLLRELLIPLAFCLGGFMIFWNAFNLLTELNKFQDHHLVLSDVVELYTIRLPGTLVLILPIVLLLSLLYALTNHARHHELTAIRTAGVSLWRICVPYFAVGLLLSLALFYMNEKWVADAADREDEILSRHQQKAPGAAGRETKIGFDNTRDGRRWTFSAYDPQQRVITRPVIFWTAANGAAMQLVASRAEYIDGVWTFFDVRQWFTTPDAKMEPLPQTNSLAMPEFSETPELIKREISFANRLTVRSAQSTEVPISAILDHLDLHPHDLPVREKWWLYTQLHGRLAAPWTCLVVVLIAIPFGAASGRRNLFVGVAGSIAICFTYFVLLKFGLALGTGGYVPAWLAAWFPNIFFGIAGLWLMLRVR